jgi:hypothetical protein
LGEPLRRLRTRGARRGSRRAIRSITFAGFMLRIHPLGGSATIPLAKNTFSKKKPIFLYYRLMFNDNDILDAPEKNTQQKPPADTKTEKTMYLGIIFFQYFLILVGAAAKNSPEIVATTWIIAFILHPIMQFILFFSSIVGYANTKDPKRLAHFILLIACLVFGFAGIDTGLGGFFLIIMPHGLAWFYIYILHAQQKERERLLPLYKPVKKRK